MKIVIPMAGAGERFIKAGYKQIKPLIEIEGKPMIEHVINMFPGESDFLFVCNQDHLTKTDLGKVLKRLAPASQTLGIAPHKLGPVYSLLQAVHQIADEQEVLVNYCDFSAKWDYQDFKQTLQRRKPAGCVTAYRGFHPHSLGPNLYAYMREKDGYLLEIKEKGCFTDNRMNEYASAGTYYFSLGAHLKKYCQRLFESGQTVNGEYFASMPFNLMVADGLPVLIYELQKFLQWGTPEDLQEYLYWSDHFRLEAGWSPKQQFDFQVLIPMAGAGQRFQNEGYALPKPLIDVAGQPMVAAAVSSLPISRRYFFVCRSEHLQSSDLRPALLNRFGSGAEIIEVDRLTEGQACTCLLAREFLDPEMPLLIGACDNGMVWNERRFSDLIQDKSIDCIAWTFRNYVPAQRKPQMYGWLENENGVIKHASVKVPISAEPLKDPAIVGTFWFRKARYFLEAVDDLIARNLRVNNEFYVDSCINTLLASGRKAVLFDIDRYICWGTPADLKTWQYWREYFQR